MLRKRKRSDKHDKHSRWEIATYTGEGIGRFDASGLLTWRGAIFFHTSLEGKLEFLNNKVGYFEAQVDSQGNFTDETWEWK